MNAFLTAVNYLLNCLKDKLKKYLNKLITVFYYTMNLNRLMSELIKFKPFLWWLRRMRVTHRNVG